MGSKPLALTAFAWLLAFLGVSYGLGYWLGFRLTGSAWIALAPAFGMACLAMFVGVLLATGRESGRADRAGMR